MKRFFHLLWIFSLLSCTGTPSLPGTLVYHLSGRGVISVHSGDRVVWSIGDQWFDPENPLQLYLNTSGNLWFHFPDNASGQYDLVLSWAGRPDTELSFFMNGSFLGKAKSRFVLPSEQQTAGIHRVEVVADHRINLDFIKISHGSVVHRVDSPVTPDVRTRLRGLSEYLRQGTFSWYRDHHPGILIGGSGSVDLSLNLNGPARAFHANLRSIEGSKGKLMLTLQSDQGVMTREFTGPDEFDQKTIFWEFEEPVILHSGDIHMESDRSEEMIAIMNPFLSYDAPHSKPNLLLVTLDTTRMDSLGCYGRNPSVTPNLDALSLVSTRYTTAIAPTPWTLPSHASLLTGQAPARHGAGVWSTWIAPGWKTLADYFGDLGYMTGGFSGGQLTKGKFGLARGFALYRDPRHFERKADALTKDVIEFIADNQSFPFFIFVNYFDPHAPYQAPDRYKDAQGIRSLLKGKTENDPVFRLAHGFPDAWDDLVNGRVPLNEEITNLLEKLYLAEVSYMDRMLGQLINFLKENGLFQNTIIVVAGDHGEFLGEHGLLTHTTRLYEPVLQIPMMIYHPADRTGRVITEPVILQDLYPTILSMVLPDLDPECDGLDIRVKPPARRVLLAEEHLCLPVHPLIDWMKSTPDLYALYLDRTKVILNRGGSAEVYDLETDPGENRDLAGDRPRLVERAKKIVDIHESLLQQSDQHGTFALSAEDRQALKALGYLQ